MKAALALKPRSTQDAEAIEAFLKELLGKAAAGSLTAIVVIAKEGEQYHHSRLGVTYETAAGLLARAQHPLQCDWDAL